MNVTLLIAVTIGLALGLLINYLADVLPAVRESNQLEDAESVQKKSSFSKSEESGEVIPSLYGFIRRTLPGADYQRPTFASAARYPLAEAVTIAAAVYLTRNGEINAQYVVHLFYLWLFLLIAVIDIEHRLILNIVMFPAFVVALLEVALNSRVKFADALIGYAAAQIIVMALYLLGFVYLWVINTNREQPVTEVAFGFGDVTLATFCGLVVGNPDVYFMLFYMIIFGAVSALGTIIIFAVLRGGKFRAHMAIPYGPSIVAAATVMLLSQAAIPWNLFYLFR